MMNADPVYPVPCRATQHESIGQSSSQRLMRQKGSRKQKNNETRRDRDGPKGGMALKQAEGNAGIMNQAEVKNTGNNGNALSGFQKTERKPFGQLI